MNITLENTSDKWNGNFALLDCGEGHKVEKFGAYILTRPEPQALWQLSEPLENWLKKSDAFFARHPENPEKGHWHIKPGVSDPWFLSFAMGNLQVQSKLSFSAFKHVGIFPEQISNWYFVSDFIKKNKGKRLHMLNLFAYTGMASVIAAMEGVDVTHVDSIKQVLNWANENKKINHVDSIRWMAEDALKFIQREQRRRNSYDIIVMDPPAYGRGPNGEKWVLTEKLDGLLTAAMQVLKSSESCMIINQYSMGMSPTLAYTHLMRLGAKPEAMSLHELCVTDSYGKVLPLGTCVRYTR